MRDIFNAMKGADKERRHERKSVADSLDFSSFKKFTPWHWQTKVNGKTLDYWPTKNKWRFNKKVNYGTAQDCLNFIKKREDKL